MKRKSLSMLLISALLLAVVGGTAASKTVIEVWGIPADDVGKNLLASEFNAAQSEYEVKVVHGAFGFAESPEKLMTAVAAGTAPPVVLLDRMTVADWAARGALMPLDAIAERADIKRGDYVDAVWESCMFNGKLYALPSHFNLTCSYLWNKDMYATAGLDPESPPTSWDEWLEVTRKTTVRDSDGNVVQAGFQFGYHALLYTLSWQNGGRYSPDPYALTANMPENVRALEMVGKLYEAVGGRTAYDLFDSSTVTATGQDKFSGQSAAAIRGGTWFMDVYEKYAPDLNYGLTTMPIPQAGVRANILGGRSMVIMNGTKGKQLDGAIAFATWVAKEGGLVVWKGGRHLPAKNEDFERLMAGDPDVWGLSPVFEPGKARIHKQLEDIPYGRSRPINPVNAYLYDQLVRAWDNVTYEKMTPQEALDDVQTEVQRALDRFWSTQR